MVGNESVELDFTNVLYTWNNVEITNFRGWKKICLICPIFQTEIIFFNFAPRLASFFGFLLR